MSAYLTDGRFLAFAILIDGPAPPTMKRKVNSDVESLGVCQTFFVEGISDEKLIAASSDDWSRNAAGVVDNAAAKFKQAAAETTGMTVRRKSELIC
jgi:hypothetical protein